MNNDRRKRINSIKDELISLKSQLESILEEEQDYRDNMPDSIGEGVAGERADQNIGNLQDAIEGLEHIESSLDEAAE